MFNRPYIVEVRHEIEYLEQVIRETRWQHAAAYNTSRMMEPTYEILLAKCRIVTYRKRIGGGSAVFPFDIHGNRHRSGSGYTLNIYNGGTNVMNLEMVRASRDFGKKYALGHSSVDEAPSPSYLAPIEELQAEQVLDAIRELSILEVMEG